jgi:regulator of nucleoside diphosphate kinase
MNTYVISDEDRRDILAMLDEYQPYLHSEVEQKSILRDKLAEAVIVPAERRAHSVVAMHSVVRVVDLRQRQEATYTLVYPSDASPGHGRVSLLSPLGTALLGCEEGAIIEIVLPVSTIPFAVRSVLRTQRGEEAKARPAAKTIAGGV